MIVRPERAGDEAAIRAVTRAAFATAPHGSGIEQDIVDALRTAGDLTLSLVAEDARGVVGHIAFSPVAIEGGKGRWFGLGPVSARPDRQRRGVGSALIRRGIADMRRSGARGIVLLGDPGYYGRFGFAHDPALCYPGPPPAYFQRLVLEGEAPSGVVTYAPAFG